jgi:hypothetical protein
MILPPLLVLGVPAYVVSPAAGYQGKRNPTDSSFTKRWCGMLYSRFLDRIWLPGDVLGPLRIGFFYGMVAAIVALAADLRFLFIDPSALGTWVIAVVETYRSSLALATCLFLGLLAALKVRPTRLDPGVPHTSLLLRDGALAATMVAVMFGATVFLTTALQATLLADQARAYAEEAAPRIVSYLDELARRLHDPSPATVGEVESDLQPPALHDLGRSIANFVLRAVFLGTLGGLVGVLRGRFGASPGDRGGKPPRE